MLVFFLKRTVQQSLSIILVLEFPLLKERHKHSAAQLQKVLGRRGVFFKVLCQETHVTNVMNTWKPWNPLGLPPASSTQGAFLSKVKSQESIFKKAYLVICVLVLKSRDLIERRTSMQPKYCKRKKHKSWTPGAEMKRHLLTTSRVLLEAIHIS